MRGSDYEIATWRDTGAFPNRIKRGDPLQHWPPLGAIEHLPINWKCADGKSLNSRTVDIPPFAFFEIRRGGRAGRTVLIFHAQPILCQAREEAPNFYSTQRHIGGNVLSAPARTKDPRFDVWGGAGRVGGAPFASQNRYAGRIARIDLHFPTAQGRLGGGPLPFGHASAKPMKQDSIFSGKRRACDAFGEIA